MIAGASACTVMLACGPQVANGVGEETNTFAGVLIDGAGNTIAGVPVFARHFILDTVVYADTTDDNGKFGLPVTLQGQYGLSAQTDSLAYYSTIFFDGTEQKFTAVLEKANELTG